jgi:hypothetical protein
VTRRLLLVLTLVLATLIPAGAAVAAPAKAAVLAEWTQPTASSFRSWNAARLDRETWASYDFDWSTDYCTVSPQRPLGFNFAIACWHHDFGYRNYKALGRFAANKDRVDDTFYADLKRVCTGYADVTRPTCYSLAWIYYEAVHVFGSLIAVRKADLNRAAELMER